MREAIDARMATVPAERRLRAATAIGSMKGGHFLSPAALERLVDRELRDRRRRRRRLLRELAKLDRRGERGLASERVRDAPLGIRNVTGGAWSYT
ncbi:MAG TPA: hypothetical protein VJQ09_07680 [Candidatus Limnocylindria bacterium]|nr:hypothetical protein [Candidatus Limnocylindria bacterium]